MAEEDKVTCAKLLLVVDMNKGYWNRDGGWLMKLALVSYAIVSCDVTVHTMQHEWER